MTRDLAPRCRPPVPTSRTRTARVMVCDDSTVIRGAIARILESDPGIAVVAKVDERQAGCRSNPAHQVDVVVLDIEMPVMDGMTALPQLLRADPGVRVIMASTLTTRGAEIALRALRLGASDYVPKPSTIGTVKVTTASSGSCWKRSRASPACAAGGSSRRGARAADRACGRRHRSSARLLAIGSSTGGPQALFTLVQGLGRSVGVPVVITQHMPATFTPILADHLNRLGLMPCTEARDGESLVAGRIYLAPGDRHLLVEGGRTASGRDLTTDPPENFCRPSVDPMLRCAASACDGRVLVAMLTGMGQDGLAGTQKVIEAGGAAIGQDEASSVVGACPARSRMAGLCHAVLPLPKIAPRLLEMLKGARA